MIEHNGVTYQDSDLIDWDTAMQVGGFYFCRAKYLGLPLPPACFVFDLDKSIDSTPEQILIIGKYHTLFSNADYDMSMQETWWQSPAEDWL